MTGVLWGIAGAAGAVGLEYVYRHSGRSWLELMPLIFVAQLIVSRSIWEIVHAEGNIVAVSIYFSAGTAILRVLATLYAGDVVSNATWAGFSLVTLATGVKVAERILK